MHELATGVDAIAPIVVLFPTAALVGGNGDAGFGAEAQPVNAASRQPTKRVRMELWLAISTALGRYNR